MKSNQKTWFSYVALEPIVRDNFDPGMLFSIELILEKDVIHHDRSVYTLLDLLGDVGGLFDALKGISSIIVGLYFNIFGNPMHEYLLKAIFMRNPEH